MELAKAIALIGDEYMRASQEFPPFHTNHEGYGIIKEELDELWDEIKNNHPHHKANSTNNLKREAIQVAAMALRFLIDRC